MLNMDPFERQVWRLLTLVVLISVINVPLVSAYCWQVGQNPSFTAQPIVQQVDLRTVRVTWEGLVAYEKCVDNYLVKYWMKSNPQGYKMTDLIDKQHYTSDIIITPKVNYVFQVIAREDKGGILGIDYNKSDLTEFKTSAYNSNVKPTTPKPARKPEVVPKATGTDNGIIESPESRQELQEEVVREENGGKLLAGFNIELIAIIIVCSIVLLLILVGLVYKLTCAKKTEDIDDDDDEDEHDDDGDDFEKERLDVWSQTKSRQCAQ